MAYTTTAEVQSDFKNLLLTAAADPAPSNVTLEDVTQFIVESDALINSYVGQRYVTPVTADAGALALLKLFSRSLTAERIRAIMEVKQITNNDANQQVRRALLRYDDVIKELSKIRDNVLSLSGATENSPSGPFHSSNYADGITPEIKKGERQW